MSLRARPVAMSETRERLTPDFVAISVIFKQEGRACLLPFTVHPDIEIDGLKQAEDAVEESTDARLDRKLAARDNGDPPLGKGAGDDGGLHVSHNRIRDDKRHPAAALKDVLQVSLISTNQDAEGHMRHQMRQNTDRGVPIFHGRQT